MKQSLRFYIVLFCFPFLIVESFSLGKIMTDPDAPSPSDPYLREHLHW